MTSEIETSLQSTILQTTEQLKNSRIVLESISNDTTLSTEAYQSIADNIREMLLLLQTSAARIAGSGVEIDIPSDMEFVNTAPPVQENVEDETKVESNTELNTELNTEPNSGAESNTESGSDSTGEPTGIFIVKVNDTVKGYVYSETDAIEYMEKYVNVVFDLFSDVYFIRSESSEDGRMTTFYGRTRCLLYEYDRPLMTISYEEILHL